MNKILALVNLELKRNSRFYLIYIGLFASFMVGGNVSRINSILKEYKLSPNESSIKYQIDTYGGVSFGESILGINRFTLIVTTLGVLGLLIYSIYIWIREYTESNKTIYTLLSIPENRFSIYISKMISSVTMVHGYVLAMLSGLIVSKIIFNIRFKGINILKTSIENDLNSYYNLSLDTLRRMIPMDFYNYIITYGFMLVAGLSILFTITILFLSYKNSEKLPIVVIIVFILSLMYLKIRFSIGLYIVLKASVIGKLGVDILVDSLTILIMGAISYKLLNEKIAI